jgi:pyridoxal phosphate phosphatase PHOSPHO2
MSNVALKMFEEGVSRAQIEEVIKRMPVFEEVLEAINVAGLKSVQQIILSDANTVYISHFLESKGLDKFFSLIVSNPASWSSSGLLLIQPYQHELNDVSDVIDVKLKCPLCPTNLCKGQVLSKIQTTLGSDDRVLYIGDGGNDLCPCLRLRECDFVAARNDFRLEKCLQQNSTTLKAKVTYWNDGKTLSELINKFISDH